MSDRIDVEVVYARPERQWSLELALPAGATVADALAVASAREEFAGLDLADAAVGVWGQVVADRLRPLVQGDRIEIYRRLLVDPAEARRRRAEAALRARSRS
jgi:hypothetical protein